MTIFARLLPLPAARRTPAARTFAIAAVLAAMLTTLLFAASPAGAIVTTVEVAPSESRTFGVEPHANKELFIPFTEALQNQEDKPVMSHSNVYSIYWDPAVLRAGEAEAGGRPGKYHGDWQELINTFLQGVGAESGALGSVFALTAQYTGEGGASAAYSSTFRGGIVDHNTYPTDGCTDPAKAANGSFACFTDHQLRTELVKFIEANKLRAGPESIFYMLTPPGVTVCLDEGTVSGHCSDSSKEELLNPGSAEEEESYKHSFCSYHAVASTAGAETVLYASIPWTLNRFSMASDCQNGTGVIQEPNQSGLGPDGTYDHALPDVLINQIAAEQIAMVTDPQLNAWMAPLTNYEVPDQCRNWFEGPPVVTGSAGPDAHTKAGSLTNQSIGGRPYYLNTEFNQAALYYDYPGIPCELHVNLVPAFTVPNPVKAGDVVTFDGAESDVALGQSADTTPLSQPLRRAVFTWNFGDGTAASGPGYSETNPAAPLYASPTHAYTYGGTYEVTLTISDGGGNTATISHLVTVAGSPAPKESGAGAGGSAAGSGTPGSAAIVTPPVPTPVVAAAVISRTLHSATKGGVVVRYSVNEQVAGRFEVLLNSALARRLGISGSPAVGLPAGSAAQLVVAKAIIVTTTGGRGTVAIQFSKRTAQRLAKQRRVAFMLRMIVRNAASHPPASTTVLASFTLTR